MTTEKEMKAYLEPQEVERLEQAAAYLRDKLLIKLLFRLGCRVSEALGISIDDIDFARGTVTIEHLKTRVKLSCPDCGTGLGKTTRFCPGCGHSVAQAVEQERERRRQRDLPLDQETMDMVRDFIDRGGPVNVNGKRRLFGINRHRAWQIVRDCAVRAQLPSIRNQETGKVHNVSPHRLRDAFAVNAVKTDDSGDGLRMLQQHLGHQSIVTTMRYRKVSGEEQRQWYSRLWGGKDDGDSNHK